jgi:hypothetical protein
MDCQKISNRAGRMIDESLDDDFAIDTLNEFQDDIADTFPPVGTTTINATANTWYDLPTDCIGIYEDKDGAYCLKSGEQVLAFEFRNIYPVRQVMFYEDGTYTLKYDKTPTEITKITDTPDMHPYLQSLGALFLASRYKSMDDGENQDAQRLMQEYELRKKKRFARLMSGPSKVVVE